MAEVLVRDVRTSIEQRKTLQPHQERVIAEQRELHARATKLEAFLGMQVFSQLPTEERLDLREQLVYMLRYEQILRRRIARFQTAEAA